MVKFLLWDEECIINFSCKVCKTDKMFIIVKDWRYSVRGCLQLWLNVLNVWCVSQFYLNQHWFLSIIIVQFLLWVEKCITKFSCEVICFCECRTAKVLVIARDQWYSVWGMFAVFTASVKCVLCVSQFYLGMRGREPFSTSDLWSVWESVCVCMCDEMSVSSCLCKHYGLIWDGVP